MSKLESATAQAVDLVGDGFAAHPIAEKSSIARHQ
jgi:hypothetical protein